MFFSFLFFFLSWRMTKIESNLIEEKSGLLKLKKPLLRGFSIKLKRLSYDTIQHHLKGVNHHNINVSIHGNEMKIGNSTFKSMQNTFNVRLKVTSTGVTVLKTSPPRDLSAEPIVSCTPIARNLRPKPKLDSNVDLAIVNVVPKSIVHKPSISNRNISNAWRMCKNSQEKNEFCVNDIVMAKVRGFSPWPGKIIEIVKNRIKIEFYGANVSEKFGFVNRVELAFFKNCADLIHIILERNSLKELLFRKGVKEAEIDCGVPEILSIVEN